MLFHSQTLLRALPNVLPCKNYSDSIKIDEKIFFSPSASNKNKQFGKIREIICCYKMWPWPFTKTAQTLDGVNRIPFEVMEIFSPEKCYAVGKLSIGSKKFHRFRWNSHFFVKTHVSHEKRGCQFSVLRFHFSFELLLRIIKAKMKKSRQEPICFKIFSSLAQISTFRSSLIHHDQLQHLNELLRIPKRVLTLRWPATFSN